MREHGDLLWQMKWRHGMMEARKHLVQYLHGFPWVKEYRSSLVQVESNEDIYSVIDRIRQDHPSLLTQKLSGKNPESLLATWNCGID
jgi:tRNA-dihydrouridine synthase